MREILLRARKPPFEVVAPEDALVRNTIADNAGNLIFSMAAHRILETATTSVTADRFSVDRRGADAINERYDAYVLPLANAFRPSYEATLIRLTELIRRLRVPVVVLGVGAQAGLTGSTGRLRPMERSIREFVSAVLDHGPSIGVRGEVTRDFLVGLGYRDVEVIGCPSLFFEGDRLRVTKRRATLDRDARLAINISPYVTEMGPIVARHVERYPNLITIAQDIDTLEMLLWGETVADVEPDDPRPIHVDHPLVRDGRVRTFVDPWPWIESLRDVDFSFGTRIHGNIAALMAGTPAVVLAHDSRTLELARYFEIPHRLLSDLPPDVDAADLHAAADYGPLVAGHPARWATFAAYLARHGLEHAFAAGEPTPSFAERLATTPFPPAVTTASRIELRGLGGRVKRARRSARRLLRRRWTRRARVAITSARAAIGRRAGKDR